VGTGLFCPHCTTVNQLTSKHAVFSDFMEVKAYASFIPVATLDNVNILVVGLVYWRYTLVHQKNQLMKKIRLG